MPPRRSSTKRNSLLRVLIPKKVILLRRKKKKKTIRVSYLGFLFLAADKWTAEFKAALAEGKAYLTWREFFRKRRQEMTAKAKEELSKKSLKASGGRNASLPPPDPVTVKSIGTMD